MIHRPGRAASRPRDGQPEPASSSGHDRRSYTTGWDAIYPDGRRVPQTWLVGGGLLPSESPWGKFAYAEPIDFRFAPGETRRFSYTLKAGDSRTSSGTMVFTVEGLEKAAFGECQATVVMITNATAGADGRPYTRIRRRFIRELRYFTFSNIEVVKDGKSQPVTLEATRIELIQ
jgi:hypothetical protein